MFFFYFHVKQNIFRCSFFSQKFHCEHSKLKIQYSRIFSIIPFTFYKTPKKKLHLNWLKSIHLRYEINQFILFLFSLLWNELNHLIMHFKNKNKKNTKITGPILFWGKWKLKQKKTLTWFALGKISYNIIQIAFEHTYVFFFF